MPLGKVVLRILLALVLDFAILNVAGSRDASHPSITTASGPT
jgi:hypothetical protein